MYNGLDKFKIIELLQTTSEIVKDKIGQIINLTGLRNLLVFEDLRTDPSTKNLKGHRLYQILNNRLKQVLYNLVEAYAEDKIIIDKKIGFSNAFEEIKEQLDDNQQEMLQKFIDVSYMLTYIKNMVNDKQNQQIEEMEMLILKRKIFSQ